MHLELYETCMPERFCENNEQPKESMSSKTSITDLWQFLKMPLDYTLRSFHSIYFTSRTKTLLNTTTEDEQYRKFQNFRGKKLTSMNIRRILFSRTSLGRLLLKLIYWNKLITIKRANIIIIANEYQEQPPKINKKFPRRQL